MKGLSSKISKGITTRTRLHCADNTGARVLELISVKGYKGVKNRYPSAGIGSMIKVSVKKGTPEMRKQIFDAVIIRQRKEFRRPDGMRVKFEDNAAVITDEDGNPRGTEIKGAIAKESCELYTKIAQVGSIIV